MLLRSSSTPVLGSLVSSCSDSPNNSHNHHHYYQPEVTALTPNRHPPLSPTPHKITFHHSPLSQNLNTFSSNSSPSIHNNGFRRAQSEGNLESLARTSASSNEDEFSFANPSKKFPTRHNSSLLETIPSFSFRKSTARFEDDHFSDEEEEEEEEDDDEFNKYDHYTDSPIEREGRLQDPNLDIEKKVMALNEQMRHVCDYGNVALKDKIEDLASQMYLAKGLGVEIGFGGGGSGGNYTPIGFGKSGGNGDSHNIEEHYKKMVNDNPGNPLYLRNYAQYLYQSKQDLNGAEEYYSRAILADPNDGEILSQYANILWEHHQDKDRATSYYERAVQAASEDSHVHAAYASFLWEAEDEEEGDAQNDSIAIPTVFHKGAATPTPA